MPGELSTRREAARLPIQISNLAQAGYYVRKSLENKPSRASLKKPKPPRVLSQDVISKALIERSSYDRCRKISVHG